MVLYSSGLKIFGILSMCKSEMNRLGIPDNMFITGYLTNQGKLYSFSTRGYHSLTDELYTEKELGRHFKTYNRREKLRLINSIK